jgi:hypothetical protein
VGEKMDQGYCGGGAGMAGSTVRLQRARALNEDTNRELVPIMLRVRGRNDHRHTSAIRPLCKRMNDSAPRILLSTIPTHAHDAPTVSSRPRPDHPAWPRRNGGCRAIHCLAWAQDTF